MGKNKRDKEGTKLKRKKLTLKQKKEKYSSELIWHRVRAEEIRKEKAVKLNKELNKIGS